MNSRQQIAYDLLAAQKTGILATNSRKKPGYPFASLTPYCLGPDQQPLFLMSRLAVHSKNLTDDRRCTLLITTAPAFDDPLNTPRAMLMGRIEPVPEENLDTARELYLKAFPDAAEWIEFGDFSLQWMHVDEIYVVAGFGEMGWTSPNE